MIRGPWLRSALVLLLAVAAGCTSPEPEPGALDLQQRSDARMELARAYFVDGKYAIALEEADRALQLNPRRADALGLRGLALMNLGEREQAAQSLRNALRIAPEDPGLQNNMGWLLCETGKATEGLPYFDRALENRRYASPANAAMNAGVCSLKLGDRARADKYFRRALQADPGLIAAQAGLARLAFERNDFVVARAQMLPVIASGQASADDYALAIRIERGLGDRDAERSLIAQWQRRLPDSPQLQAFLRGE